MMNQMMKVLSLCLLASVHGSNDFGIKFLEDNKGKDGVITLASGLQYKVLNEGQGDEHPLASTQCSCHYEGRTAQEYPAGKTFDSSYARGDPASFAPSGVIAGWTEAMQLMVQGDKWEMYIPSELGYGDSGSGANIGGGDVLVFTMEIMAINGASKPAERGPPSFTELTSATDFEGWINTAGNVVGVFRTLSPNVGPSGKLFNAFKGAARSAKKAGKPEFAFLTHSVFDVKTGKYGPTSIAEEFTANAEVYPSNLKAPNVYVKSLSTGKWKKCKTNAKDIEVSSGDVKTAILNCAQGKKAKKVKDSKAGKEELDMVKEEL